MLQNEKFKSIKKGISFKRLIQFTVLETSYKASISEALL